MLSAKQCKSRIKHLHRCYRNVLLVPFSLHRFSHSVTRRFTSPHTGTMVLGRIIHAIPFLFTSLAVSTPLSLSNEPNTPGALLDKSLTALGGQDAIAKLAGLTYHAPKYVLIAPWLQRFSIPADWRGKHLSFAEFNAKL